MSWKWVSDATPITGVPALDYSDEEFAAVQLAYEASHYGVDDKGRPLYGDDDPGALERCGLWRHYGPNDAWEEAKSEAVEAADEKEGD